MAAPPSQVTGNDIATAGLRFKGTPYTWGGFLPSTGWDCSGFVGYILGHTFGMKLPGGFVWSGRSHGPVAAMYKTWSLASTVSQASPGVLCCWLTHIGIAVNGTQMISAFDTQLGTAVTGFQGPPGEPLSFRQINIVGASSPGGGPGTGVQSCPLALLMMPALLVRGVVRRGRHAGDEEARGGD